MKVKVKKDCRCAYPDPLIARKGDTFTIKRKKAEWRWWKWCIRTGDGKRGWIPRENTRIIKTSCK